MKDISFFHLIDPLRHLLIGVCILTIIISKIVHVVEPPHVTFEEPQPSLSANSRQNSASHDENGA
jgi:hypothetical protein